MSWWSEGALLIGAVMSVPGITLLSGVQIDIAVSHPEGAVLLLTRR